MGRSLLGLVAGFTVFIFLFLIGMPTIAFGYLGFPFILFVSTIIFMAISTSENNKKNAVIPGIIVFSIFIYVTLFQFFSTSAFIRTQKYRNLIGTVKQGEDFSTHITPISTEKIRIVDQDLAKLLGDKVLGNQPALGSQVILGQFSIQKVKNQLYWVAPLLHSGFLKWYNNKQGTNGYVMVSATNERDVKLVQNINGKPIYIKYQQNAYFGSFLERHIYFSGFMTQGFTDYSFEIDDNGKPYYVATLYDKTIGFSGEDAVGTLLVDCESGEIKKYSIKDTPLWVDRIQPEDFIKDQVNDWGKYVNGYFNYSNQDKLQVTEDPMLVYGEDNRSYWYTGLTSVGKDESTVGFVLVDTRTKETTWYKQGGATEFAAQNSAQGKVQEKGYYSTIPIPYNINGVPTYVMSLKDKGGLIKMFAMVSIRDYTTVGVGNSLNEALMAYKAALNSNGTTILANSKSELITLKDKIDRFSADVKNGNTFYYFTVKSISNKIFIGTNLVSQELPLTLSGDEVEFVYDKADESQEIDVSKFNNLMLGKKDSVEIVDSVKIKK